MNILCNGIYRREDDELYVIIGINDCFDKVLTISNIPKMFEENRMIRLFLKRNTKINIEVFDEKFFNNCSFLGFVDKDTLNVVVNRNYDKIMESMQE